MTDPMDPAERIRELVEQARRKREQNRGVRAQFAAARAAGLRRRHAAKLRRLRGDVTDLESLPDDDGPSAA